jgi:hypothetical protein
MTKSFGRIDYVKALIRKRQMTTVGNDKSAKLLIEKVSFPDAIFANIYARAFMSHFGEMSQVCSNSATQFQYSLFLVEIKNGVRN